MESPYKRGQSSNERDYNMKRKYGGRGLKSFKEVYSETKVRVACYITASTDKRIQTAWRNESRKEQRSLKKEAEKAARNVNTRISFDEGQVVIDDERYAEQKVAWKKAKYILNKRHYHNKKQKCNEKEHQSEILKQYNEIDYDCNKQ